VLDFSYILFDVVRYSEEDLRRAANVVSSVFYLDQTVTPMELAGRLRKLAGVLEGMWVQLKLNEFTLHKLHHIENVDRFGELQLSNRLSGPCNNQQTFSAVAINWCIGDI